MTVSNFDHYLFIFSFLLLDDDNSDASLAGFLIPKDTHVLPNLYAIHMDPNLWTDPDSFDPTRFLRNGKVFKPDFFLPFSVGKYLVLLLSLSVSISLSLSHCHERNDRGSPLSSDELDRVTFCPVSFINFCCNIMMLPSTFLTCDSSSCLPCSSISCFTGRRMCLGDVLTKMEVFLFLTSLIQSYELCVPSEESSLPVSDMGGTAAVSVVPKPFQVSLRPRRGNNNKKSDISL